MTQYIKLFEDWEAPGDWDQPDEDSLEATGLSLDPVEGARLEWTHRPELWANGSVRQLAGGEILHIICGVSSRLVRLPRVWKGRSCDWILDQKSMCTLSITLKSESQLDTLTIIGSYHQAGSEIGCINIEWTWAGEKSRVNWSWIMQRVGGHISEEAGWIGSPASYHDF